MGVCVCAVDAQLEDSLQKLVLSFCFVGTAHWTLVNIMSHDQSLLPTEPSLRALVHLCLIVKKLLRSGIHPRRDRRERGGDGEKERWEGRLGRFLKWLDCFPSHTGTVCVLQFLHILTLHIILLLNHLESPCALIYIFLMTTGVKYFSCV